MKEFGGIDTNCILCFTLLCFLVLLINNERVNVIDTDCILLILIYVTLHLFVLLVSIVELRQGFQIAFVIEVVLFLSAYIIHFAPYSRSFCFQVTFILFSMLCFLFI
jgi:hypothetical protein